MTRDLRWIGGPAMIAAPLLLLAGMLLRFPVPFFFPHQLAAAVEHPGRMSAAYTCVLAGTVLLCPAVLALAARVGTGWGTCGAVLVVTGLFGRVFHAGFDQAALALARHRGAGFATAFVGDAYGELHLFSYLTFTILLGWPVLAFAAWRARVLHPVQALGLAATAALPLGVLKGTTALSLVAVAGLGVALVPAGVRLLRTAPRPDFRLVAAAVPVVGLLAYVSTLG
ncbi:hypothetical protein GCM10017786_26580 [Amycolatopsis deserti]|uniref:Uncharacterized protein n=1 Tax=Amycolatopsis deserti TaxID=185696 RepID=A0ABQ3ITQ0_9PSEU|nr:hypothetical protein [Amycolatopsis deserti]GHE92594.1 hypothetical protein GCM10017786_26580 [Amycolatopsis deserti]